MERGKQLETRVFDLLGKLKDVGMAKDIKMPDVVKDFHGNTRRVDISFTLRSIAIELLVNIECKSHERRLTLEKIDQIKTFKAELIGRNLFWLVYEGDLGGNVVTSLEKCGISYFQIDDFETTVSGIVKSLNRNSAVIKRMENQLHMFSMMSVPAMNACDRALRRVITKSVQVPRIPFWRRLFGERSISRYVDGRY